jgi:hypothetical protein
MSQSIQEVKNRLNQEIYEINTAKVSELFIKRN